MNIERLDGKEKSEFEKKKTKYFSDFALKNMKEMRILARGGVLGEESEGWRNVSEHCLAEAVVADILAEHLGAKREDVVRATLLHDWYKRKEIEAMKEFGGGDGYKKTIEEDEKKLKEYGISDHMIKLAHLNIPENTDKDYLQGRQIEEKIVHFADHIIQGSEIVGFNDRLRALEQKGKNLEFSESFREKYDGKTLFDVQYGIVCSSEQEEFERKLKLEPGKLIEFIKEKVKERIENTAI